MKLFLFLTISVGFTFSLRADAVSTAPTDAAVPAGHNQATVPTTHNEATIAQLKADMAANKLSSEDLVREYLARIAALDQNVEGVNAIMELNPDALELAKRADKLRHGRGLVGSLNGIPVVLKDNIDTGDKMQTSAGSFALVG
ncbi:MAG TPA: amidase family protein, partial [Chthoniobacterales bacterium]